MAALTEGRHAAQFILSEANGNRSRENGTLKSGEDLEAGTVVEDDGSGKLVEYDATSQEAAGILIETTDATTGDKSVAYLARDAEVNANILTYPEGELAATTASLALLGIIVR